MGLVSRCTMVLAMLVAAQFAAAQSVRTTKITYDSAGRPSQIDAMTSSTGPSITSAAPSTFRRTVSTHVVVIGSELNGATVSGDGAGFQFTAVNSTPTQVTFDVVAGLPVSLGAHTLTLTTPVGSASTGITIRQEPPTLLLADQPWVLGVGDTLPFATPLSTGDDVARSIAISNSTPAIGTVTPATLDFAIGSVQPATPLAATGVALGITQLVFTDPEIATRKRALFVSPRYQAATNEVHGSAAVGVQFGEIVSSTDLVSASSVVGVDFASAAGGTPLDAVTPAVGVMFGDTATSTAVDTVSGVVGVMFGDAGTSTPVDTASDVVGVQYSP